MPVIVVFDLIRLSHAQAFPRNESNALMVGGEDGRLYRATVHGP